MSELSLFLRRALRNPRQISALAPSSPALARKMAAALPPGGGPVVEFGPGTGRITSALLQAGVLARDLTLFEMEREFCAHLRERHPGIDVRNDPTQSLRRGAIALRAVVSGLPLLSIPTPIQRQILTAAFDALAPGAPLIQFTYGPRPPVSRALRHELGLSARSTGWVFDNLPPAQVYVFTRIPH